jgi:hypothetical protein
MSDYFACLDLISFRMSSALLALSPAGATTAGAASGCGAGADSVTGAALTGPLLPLEPMLLVLSPEV